MVDSDATLLDQTSPNMSRDVDLEALLMIEAQGTPHVLHCVGVCLIRIRSGDIEINIDFYLEALAFVMHCYFRGC